MNQKRKSSNSGSSSDKRPRLSGYASEIIESEESGALIETFGGETKESDSDKRQRLSGYDSGFFESEESEPSPEISAGETKETDSDRRGRQKKEREQKKTEEAAERKLQQYIKHAASKTKPCIANIGGERVEKNGIMTFQGGTAFQFESRPIAEEATGISLSAINNNIFAKGQSIGEKGVFENKQVMFINAPDDTSDKVPCPVTGCGKHYGTKSVMTAHVRAKHPEVPLPPAAKRTLMPKEYKTFTPPITQKQYSFIVNKVGSNIQNDLKKYNQKQLMALVEGYEPWGSHSINKAGEKYNLTEQQILDSIDKNEQLTIEDGRHDLKLELGRTRRINLAGLKVTFSWKHKVSEEDKIKLDEMNNRETYHKLAQQICVHMNLFGMFASENVTDDNDGLIKHGFVFESHGGLFAPSFDRIEDEYTVNGQIFHKLHYTNLEKALENIHVVAFMANVAYKASTIKIQDRYDIYKNKSEDQQKEDFKNVLVKSRECKHNGKRTPLYQHAHNTWGNDDECKGAFATPNDYWKRMLVLLKKQEGLCKVAKIPMSIESGPWLMSCDAIDPLLGHVPGNLRLVCFYNNPPDHSKQNPNPTDTTPTSLTTEIHNEYWRIVR